MYWTTGSGQIQLTITKDEARTGYHQGQCYEDLALLMRVPRLARQLRKLDPALVSEELKEYGAWTDEERQDHEENLRRLLWVACGDICEELATRTPR